MNEYKGWVERMRSWIEWMNARMNERMNEWKDGWIEWIKGMNGWTNKLELIIPRAVRCPNGVSSFEVVWGSEALWEGCYRFSRIQVAKDIEWVVDISFVGFFVVFACAQRSPVGYRMARRFAWMFSAPENQDPIINIVYLELFACFGSQERPSRAPGAPKYQRCFGFE